VSNARRSYLFELFEAEVKLMAIPTFQDWQQNMTFKGLSGAETTKARNSQKYYDNFSRAAQGKYGNAVIAQHGLANLRAQVDPMAQMMEMFSGGMEAMAGPSAEELSAEADAREAERLKTAGLNRRDELYRNYTESAEVATNYINDLVSKERSNAALMGVDYNLSDADKLTRTENYFADIWGSNDQEELQGLYDEWGYMDDMDEASAWVLRRGVGAGGADEGEKEDVAATSITGQGGSTLATQGLLAEDENPNQTSLLGA